jgi:hypothetical protein
MNDGPEWFAAKRYGYGSGMPISWQGWAVTIGFVLFVTAISLWLSNRPGELVAAMILPTVGFMVVCARTTRGGWRWRWGEDD